MFDDVDGQLDNAGAARPEDVAKAVEVVKGAAQVALPLLVPTRIQDIAKQFASLKGAGVGDVPFAEVAETLTALTQRAQSAEAALRAADALADGLDADLHRYHIGNLVDAYRAARAEVGE